jgi:hypothetical protein
MKELANVAREECQYYENEVKELGMQSPTLSSGPRTLKKNLFYDCF